MSAGVPMRAAGMPEGPSVLGSLKDGLDVIVEGGVAKLPDRSAFAGSVATADRLVRTMVAAGIPLVDVVRMMRLERVPKEDDEIDAAFNGSRIDLLIAAERATQKPRDLQA